MSDSVFFSVIIPTFNRPEKLRKCLDTMVRMKYPRDRFEVIVVDDGSPKSLELVIVAFKEQIKVRLIVQSNNGPASARNRGAKEANGDFFAFTDDDCQPDSNWLSILASQFSRTPDVIMGGHTVNVLSKNLYSAASQLLIDYLYAYYNAEFSEAPFFTSNNLAVPKHAFRKIGGFDESFTMAAGEDREICNRWRNKGYEFIYLPEAIVQHKHVLNFKSFFRQHFNYGRGAFHYRYMNTDHYLKRIQLEPKKFYLNLLRYPFCCKIKKSLSLSLLIFVSQVANTLGFFREACLFKINPRRKLRER